MGLSMEGENRLPESPQSINYRCAGCGAEVSMPRTSDPCLQPCPACNAASMVPVDSAPAGQAGRGRPDSRRGRRVRPEGSVYWLGIVSLTIVMGAWALAVFLLLLPDDDASIALKGVRILGGLACLVVFFAGGILSAISVAVLMFSGIRYGRGKGFAVAAMAISLFSCCFAGALPGELHRLFPKDFKEALEDMGSGPYGKFQSKPFGYSVNLSGMPWSIWKSGTKDVPGAETAATRDDSYYFVVIPVWIAGLNPDMDNLTAALLERMDISASDSALSQPSPTAVRSLEGRDFWFERTLEGARFRYRLQVLKGNKAAFLLAAWREDDGTTSDRVLSNVLDRVSFAGAEYGLPEPGPAALPEGVRDSHGIMYNDMAIYLQKQKHASASVEYLRKAYRYNPDPVILKNLANTLLGLEMHEEGYSLLSEGMRRFPDNPEIQAYLARAQEGTGRSEEALATYRSLFSRDYRDDGNFVSFTDILCSLEKYDEALAAADDYLRRYDSMDVRIDKSRILRAAGKPEAAAEMLGILLKDRPLNADLVLALAEACLDAGMFREALDRCAALIAIGKDTAYSRFLKGRAEYGLGLYREAKASFEAALKENPTYAEARSYLDQASSMLGQGSNTSIKTPIPEVPVPPELIPPPSQEVSPGEEGYSLVYLHRVTAVCYSKGRDLRITEYMSARIRDSKGAAEFGTLRFPFDPAVESIFINRLRVLDEKGGLAAEGSVDDAYVIDDLSDGVASHRKVLEIPVPGLGKGSLVEVAVTRRILSGLDRFWFCRRIFASTVPVRRSALYVTGDVRDLRACASRGVAVRDFESGRAWMADSPPVYVQEPMQAEIETFLPAVSVGDGTPTWKSETERYIADLAPVLGPEPRVSALAAGQTSGMESAPDKFAALAAFVQQLLSYKAIGFGRRSFVPADADDILDRKYGDCKDHALLLHLLLREAGVQSHLALVNTGNPVAVEIPDLDQFNHLIVYVPGLLGGHFVDCTDKEGNPMATTPTQLNGRNALVLDPRMPRIQRIPGCAGGEDGVASRRLVRREGADGLSVEEELVLRGAYASYMRCWLKNMEPVKWLPAVQGEMTLVDAGVQLSRLDVEEIDRNDRPVVLKLAYSMRGRVREAGGMLSGLTPCIWERSYLAPAFVKDRVSPFRISVPMRFASVVDVEVPGGFRAILPAPSASRGGNAGTTWQTAWDMHEGRPSLRFSFSKEPGEFPAAEYEPFRLAVEEALGAFESFRAEKAK